MGDIHKFPTGLVESLGGGHERPGRLPSVRCPRRLLVGIRSTLSSEVRLPLDPGALAHVIDQLRDGEGIEFRYGMTGTPAQFFLAVDVEAIGATMAAAERRAATVSALLDASLELTCPYLHFLASSTSPCEAEPASHVAEVRPSWWVLHPGGNRARHGLISDPELKMMAAGRGYDDADGDGPAAAGSQPILYNVPPDRIRLPADPLALVLRHLPQHYEVVFRLENVVLSRHQRWSLRAMATQLAYAPHHQWRATDPSRSGMIDEEELLCRLNAWHARGRGCRFRCFVASQQPGLAEHVAMIGQLVFGRSPALELQHDVGDAVDLRGAVPAALPAIYPLPTAATISSLGFPRSVPSPAGLASGGGVRIGRTDDGQAVHLGNTDRLRHTYVIGATGTGKSTLLLNMIRQDMAAGEGVILIDPHGDLFAGARRLVPSRRESDLVLLDFADFDNPVPMNMLALHGSHHEIAENFVCNELIRIFTRVLYRGVPEAFGPVFETYFRNALLLLLQGGGETMTLVDLERVFGDDAFREALMVRCAGKPVADFWRGIASKVTHQDYSLKNLAPYIVSKLTQFTSNALIRPIIAQPGSIDFRQLMDEGRIVLVNLAKGLLGELDSALLGMLVLGKVYLAALGRADTALASRRAVHLFVDEFQNIASESLGAMMSEARKFGLCVTLANQTLSQIDGRGRLADVIGPILANAGNLLVFRVGVPDAQRLACWMRPAVNAQMLAQLPDFHVAARILNGGRPMSPFLFHSGPERRLS